MDIDPGPLGDDDFASYLRKLDYGDPPAVSLATLRTLQLRHLCTFPFESITPLLGQPVRLDPAARLDKLLRQGRGGYCYELNLSYLALLRRLGFQAHGITGRVLANAPPGSAPSRTHMLVLVELDGERYISDVGFAGFTPTSPLRLDTDAVQQTEHEPYRLSHDAGTYTLQYHVGGEWRVLSAFDLTRQHNADVEVGNWYVSTNPESPFYRYLIAARMAPGRRHVLAGASYAVHRLGQPTERRELDNAEQVIAVLRDELGIRPPGGADFRQAVEQLVARHRPQS